MEGNARHLRSMSIDIDAGGNSRDDTTYVSDSRGEQWMLGMDSRVENDHTGIVGGRWLNVEG
jgi:hypothetical protein